MTEDVPFDIRPNFPAGTTLITTGTGGTGDVLDQSNLGRYVISSRGSFQAATLPDQRKKPRQVFVAYPYLLYPKADYRKVFKTIGNAFEVNFVYADEKITTLHILDKIKGYIKESQFGLYDISGWNANVTLELGLALGLGESAFIAFDPSKTPIDEVPADLRGMDRIQYGSYTELEEKLSELISQQLPLPQQHEAETQIENLRRRLLGLVTEDSGLKINDIATGLGVSTALAQVVVKPLMGHGLRSTGQKRATTYFLDPTTVPKES